MTGSAILTWIIACGFVAVLFWRGAYAAMTISSFWRFHLLIGGYAALSLAAVELARWLTS